MWRHIALAVLALFIFSGCATKVYGPDGQKIAEVPYITKGTVKAGTLTLDVEPAQNVVDGGTTVALAIVSKSPELAGVIVEKMAERIPAEPKPP